MNGKGKMTFEAAIEKLMKEFFLEKFTKGNIPREKNEEWIALDDKVKRRYQKMPYYAYAIETGSKLNHLCGTFTDYLDAEICERDQGRSYLEDRAFVKMIYAQNQTPALQRMKQIKRESGSA